MMGIVRGFLKLNLGLLVFMAGYSFCKYVNNDKRYTITRINEVPYLVDKMKQERLQVFEDIFQIGSLEYRVSGILHDKDLPLALINLKHGKYGGK